MRSEIVAVGTEILLGNIADTNSQYLAQELSVLGIDLFWTTTVGDNLGRVVEMLDRALKRSDLVLVTGGLGPTEDDLTREAIAATCGEQLYVDEPSAQRLREFFANRGMEMPLGNLKQAMLIPSARFVPNPFGTAPGWWVERNGHVIVSMPGVPREMKRMWTEQVVPRLRERQGGFTIFSRTLKVIGTSEAGAEDMVKPLLASTNPTIGTYAKPDGIHLRVTAKAETESAARALVAEMESRMREELGTYLYGCDDDTLESVVGDLLRRTGRSLAVVEGFTGGSICSMLSDVPGSSAYFKGGVVAYSRAMKESWGADAALIDRHGLVSPEVAQALALGVRERMGADVGLALIGVGGPESYEGQPAGTQHLVIDDRGVVQVLSTRQSAGRADTKRWATTRALNYLRRYLLEAGG
ncbi:MAG: competence/damage-inducible protein A [Chloroflexota bacterium]|nr:MAG: competence/damage-inducible protein A [Chloroflexota bacterium]